MTSHVTGTLLHMLCVSCPNCEWCEVVCVYMCVTVNFGATAALEEGIPLTDTPSGALCGSVSHATCPLLYSRPASTW